MDYLRSAKISRQQKLQTQQLGTKCEKTTRFYIEFKEDKRI